MAIDSKVKRASVLGIVQPDGTIDQGDRQTVLGVFRGILAGELSIATMIQITSVAVSEYVTHVITKAEHVTHSLKASEHVTHTLTVEDSV